MSIFIGDIAPDFSADTTEGKINFHEWIGDHYAILFSHPKDFTPVCTTELGQMAKMKSEFDRRQTKIIGLSVDSVEDHLCWIGDVAETQGTAVNFPLIADTELKIARLYNMIHPKVSGTETVRSVFLIGPDKKIKFTVTYPMSTGRDFNEILRALDSIQTCDTYAVATPANWQPGDDVIIPPSFSDEAAKAKYPQGFKTLKSYLRLVSLRIR